MCPRVTADGDVVALERADAAVADAVEDQAHWGSAEGLKPGLMV